MDLDQLAKRMEWLEDERRKDKMIIQTLEERLRENADQHQQDNPANNEEDLHRRFAVARSRRLCLG